MVDGSAPRARSVARPLLVAVLVAGLALATFVTFDAWMYHGADIVLALSAGNLSWCF